MRIIGFLKNRCAFQAAMRMGFKCCGAAFAVCNAAQGVGIEGRRGRCERAG